MGHISHWSMLLILICWAINTIKENTQTPFEDSRDVSLEINSEKTKYVIMSHYQN
jgi:hypothetical protein